MQGATITTALLVPLQCGWEQGAEADLLLGEPLMTGRLDQERLAQLLFEQFNINALCAVEEPVLAMYAMGKLGGTVVDIGHSRTGGCAAQQGRSKTGKVDKEKNPLRGVIRVEWVDSQRFLVHRSLFCVLPSMALAGECR